MRDSYILTQYSHNQSRIKSAKELLVLNALLAQSCPGRKSARTVWTLEFGPDPSCRRKSCRGSSQRVAEANRSERGRGAT